MKIKAYIDTNIYVYAILHHPVYGESCAEILRDIDRRVYEVYGSILVTLELLGSLSKINPHIARRATEDYLSLDITLLNINEDVIRLAAIINEIVNVRYDSIHASLILLNNIPIIITNDLDDWYRISRNIDRILEIMRKEGYTTTISKLRVIPPRKYKEWRKDTVGK